MCSNIPVKKIPENTRSHEFYKRFSIQNLENMLNGKPMIEQLHRHDFYFILALEKGIGKHEIDFISYDVTDYVIYFIKPGQVHQLLLQPESRGFLLHFSADAYTNQKSLSQLLNKVSEKDFYKFDKATFQDILSVLSPIFNEYSKREEGYDQIIKANLSILFTKLSRTIGSESNKKNTKYTQEKLEEFLSILDNNISSKKQVSQYARLMNLSMYQLNSVVKSTLGKTCSEVINERIILEAKRNLLATSNQVNQIAFLLGYDDVSYFTRLFKRHTGYSPKVFRANFK